MVASNETKEITIGPQPGPQVEFLSSPADIAIYGGAAGGGKTYALLLDPLRNIESPNFRGTIFRRTMPQVTNEGGLFDAAIQIWPYFGGRFRSGNRIDCTFPTGARVAMRQLQHENTKYDYQGSEIAWMAFDELTHFTRTQFFYLITRNRSTSGVQSTIRATCNPEAGSWVYDLISWWIDPVLGTAIKERSGIVRFFAVVDGDGDQQQYAWGFNKQEVIEQAPHLEESEVLSITFIPANLEDNPKLLESDPSYKSKLMNQPKVERERLYRGNWLVRPGSLIDPTWIKNFQYADGFYELVDCRGVFRRFAASECRRFATLDTAGTSKEKAAEKRGQQPSFSVSIVWDYHPVHNVLCVRSVWRDRVGWNDLKRIVPEFLQANGIQLLLIENAHFGQPLRDEFRRLPIKVDLVGPVIEGMDGNRDAKLERAVASGLLTRLEFHGLFVPQDSEFAWVRPFKNELFAWSGLPNEPADQIDNCSYASRYVKNATSSWGGVL